MAAGSAKIGEAGALTSRVLFNHDVDNEVARVGMLAREH